MTDQLCAKYGCDYQLDLDGQITCFNCGAMDDDMLPRRTYEELAPLSKSQIRRITKVKSDELRKKVRFEQT